MTPQPVKWYNNGSLEQLKFFCCLFVFALWNLKLSFETTEFSKQGIPWQQELFLPRRGKVNIFHNNGFHSPDMDEACNCSPSPLGLPSYLQVRVVGGSWGKSPLNSKPELLAWAFVCSVGKVCGLALVDVSLHTRVLIFKSPEMPTRLRCERRLWSLVRCWPGPWFWLWLWKTVAICTLARHRLPLWLSRSTPSYVANRIEGIYSPKDVYKRLQKSS